MTPVTRRSSGVLLHPTSLPGGLVGDVAAARPFIDWLVEAGQRYWQILPLVPVDSGGSPYNGLSAFAGNPLLVSPAFLVEQDLVEESVAQPADIVSTRRVDYPVTVRWKSILLEQAHDRFVSGAVPRLERRFAEFREVNAGWLFDYSLFRALRDHYREAAWTNWAPDIRRREPEAIARWSAALSRELDRYSFQQFLFDLEWREMRQYANERGVSIIGDLPIFVAHDSADVWANPEIFQLDEAGVPGVVSGVPPDYFSETGQRWGNPVYRWDVLRKRSYDWWVERFRRTFVMVDVVRVDHFRGFESYWEIPAAEETAIRGKWVKGPGADFFRQVEKELGSYRIIVEDLGLITSAVDDLREELDLPGMRVLQFAFDGDAENPHLPDNYPQKSVAYTGTHDNDTLSGWWNALGEDERAHVREWLDVEDPTNWDFIEVVFESLADLVVVPLQDLLGLSSDGRMNTPGVGAANWTWRAIRLPDSTIARQLLELTRRTGRG